VESINPSTDNLGDLGGDGDGFLWCDIFDILKIVSGIINNY